MAYEIVPIVWKRFISIFAQEVHQNLMLAAGVSDEVKKFAGNFKDILAKLNDAQAKEVKQTDVRDWLNKVKDISYDMDDVLDEYNTKFLILQNEKVEKALNTKMKVCFVFYYPQLFFRIVAFCRQISLKIKEINKSLDAIVKNEERIVKNEERIELSRDQRFELKPEDIKIIPSLLSCYNSLPSEVKQCLLYCAIFPKGYIINKDQLIRLWMAQGYLNVGHNREMEIEGQEYFDKIKTSLFQEFEIDRKNDVISYKIDDEVYDSLQRLSNYGLQEPLLNYSHEKVRHSSLTMLENGDIPPASQDDSSMKKLRSLFIDSLPGDDRVNLLTRLRAFTCLRALVFNAKKSPVERSLEEMGKSIYLRYLKFSETNIGELPKILCELYNLQTLDICGCEQLKELPQGIGKLVNLRYLNLCKSSLRYLPQTLSELHNLRTLDLGECEKLEALPQGMEKLKNLRNLNLCKLNIRSLPVTLCELCNLQSLDLGGCEKLEVLPQGMGKLENLRNLNLCRLNIRSLPETLYELHNLQSLDLEGCKKIKKFPQIVEFRNLRNLSLCKSDLRFLPRTLYQLYNLQSLDLGEGERFEYLPEEIEKLTNLRYLNLEALSIFDYKGETFPCNLMTSLINLRELILALCVNYKLLPPLGKLPSLESIYIGGMDSVNRVGNEFWGIEGDDKSSPVILFPKLKSLKFSLMDEWEEWNYEITSKREGKENVTIMPCLASLSMSWCFKLKALPDQLLQSTTLDELEIYWCDILEKRYKKGGDDWPKISHIPNIKIDGEYVKGGPR